MSDEATDLRKLMRRLAGSVLNMIGRAYTRTPDTVPFGLVTSIMRRHGSEQQIIQQLKYLVDSGFVSETKDSQDLLDQSAESLYRITPKGLQILNGVLSDPAIEIF